MMYSSKISLYARPVLDTMNGMGAFLCICGRIVAYNMCVYYLTVIYSMEMSVFVKYMELLRNSILTPLKLDR